LTQKGASVALTPSTPSSEQDQREAAQQNALLREVDEAVRQDQASEFAKRYGKHIIAALVIGLAAFAGYLWWNERQEAALDRASEEVVLAVEDFGKGKTDAAGRAFQNLADRQEGAAKVIGRLATAGMAVEAGKLDEGAKLYGEVAADTGAPQLYRDFATLREVTLRYDKLKPAEVEKRLAPLAVKGKPWFGSAGELLGHAYLDQGKTKQAGDLFRQIALDKDVPESIKFRARQMAGSMGVDAIENVEDTLKELRDREGPAQ
jgi:hypothetical protein